MQKTLNKASCNGAFALLIKYHLYFRAICSG